MTALNEKPKLDENAKPIGNSLSVQQTIPAAATTKTSGMDVTAYQLPTIGDSHTAYKQFPRRDASQHWRLNEYAKFT